MWTLKMYEEIDEYKNSVGEHFIILVLDFWGSDETSIDVMKYLPLF